MEGLISSSTRSKVTTLKVVLQEANDIFDFWFDSLVEWNLLSTSWDCDACMHGLQISGISFAWFQRLHVVLFM